MMDVDAYTWLVNSNIQLQGGVYSSKGHKWQIGPLQSTKKHRVVRKGAQMGFTEIEVLRSLHGLIHGQYPKGILYLFPTNDDVSDFSKARFGPLIQSNPAAIGRYVRSTDSTNIKQIGTGFLYLRGARLTTNVEGAKRDSSKLRSIPVDRVLFDERDLMSDQAIDMALERMSHSSVKEHVEFSTPTVPDFGIDRAYNESNQSVWMIKCDHCGKDTCLEIEFPNCVENNKRVCVYCKKEIFSRNGHWVALYPDREVEGLWLSQLNSPYIEPGEILRLYENPPQGNIQEVYNSKLGMAYVSIEDRLSRQRIYACCGREPMPDGMSSQCAMGVDIGKELHVVIGQRISKKQCRILKVTTVDSFNALHDLAKRYHVRFAVLDALPETHKVREFALDEEYPVYLNFYQDTISGEQWNDNTGIVKVNRTEICDRSHQLFDTVGIVEIPRRCKEVEVYAKQMCNIVKVPRDEPLNGKKVFRYKKLGADHYRHATNYFIMACFHLSPLAKNNRSGKGILFKNWTNRSKS
jgi:hypothetical protein